MKQQPFPIKYPPNYSKENFIIGNENEHAYQIISQPALWNAYGYIIKGPEGAGKTHLSHVFQQLHKAIPVELSTDFNKTREQLADVPFGVIDSLENQLAAPDTEENLFHILNVAKNEEKKILITTSLDIEALSLQKKDVISRLSALPQVALVLPQDELLTQLYYKLFADNYLKISDQIISYLVTHMPRSYQAVRETVGQIVKESLGSKATLTLKRIKDILSS